MEAIHLTSNGFNFLGVPALLGRGLLPADAIDGQDPQPVVVLSYKFWRQHFNADHGVLGQTLQLDRKNYRIVGVAAPRFTWFSGDVYLPLKLSQDPVPIYMVTFRPRLGASREATNAALQPLMEQFAKDTPKHFPEHFKVHVAGLNEWVVRDIGGTLYLLLGAVALLLAIGCGNVSILLLARGTARQQEFAVRSAVGAGRGRLVGQLLTESLLLAAIGAALGVLTAYGMLRGHSGIATPVCLRPGGRDPHQSSRPLLQCRGGWAGNRDFCSVLWPALELSRTPVEPNHAVEYAPVLAGSVRGRRAHNRHDCREYRAYPALAGRGGLGHGRFRETDAHQQLGYDPHHVMSVGIPLAENSYNTWAARGAYFEQLRAKVAEVPGVRGWRRYQATRRLHTADGARGFEILGKPAGEEQMAWVNCVSPGYFTILHIPLLRRTRCGRKPRIMMALMLR